MIRSFSISFCTVSKSFRSHQLFLPQKVSADSLDISSINAVVHMPFHSLFFHQQAFPDEVLDLDKAVRTLDLTHNKLGNSLFHFLPFVGFSQIRFVRWYGFVVAKKKKNLQFCLTCVIVRLDGHVFTAVDIPMEISKLINLQRLVRIIKF